MIYKIGTRGSKLALAQSEYVRTKLANRFPEHEFRLVTVKTTGDKKPDTQMKNIGVKGIFTKELEEELLSGAVDIAVHSMKDMPVELPEGLVLSNVWEREDTRDVLILREKKSLTELPLNATIATGSLRRKYQLLRLRPDLRIVDIRGNVETRIRKMEEEKMDGLVLAAAGVKRLNLADRITQYLEHDEMVPAPGQGALAIETAAGRDDIFELLKSFEDENVTRAVAAERHFLTLMGGGCQMPVGAIGDTEGDNVYLKVMHSDESGEHIAFAKASGKTSEEAAENAVKQLHKQRKEYR